MNFCVKLAKHILLKGLAEKNQSQVCSPLSINVVLNILAVGSKDQLLNQLLGLLEFENMEELNASATTLAQVLEQTEGADTSAISFAKSVGIHIEPFAPVISFANALWIDHTLSLKERFRNTIEDVYSTRAWAVDFQNHPDQVVDNANSWTKEKTNGLIKSILTKQDIIPELKLILANALYFKGTWEHQFRKTETRDMDFHVFNGDKVRVPFMHQGGARFDYGTGDDCQVLKMRYDNGNHFVYNGGKIFSMYIFLPNERNGLPNLLENVDLDNITFVREKIRNLWLPKFKLKCDHDLIKPLKEQGLTLPFEEDCEDLNKIIDFPSDDEGLYINKMFQKSFIEVNEVGTEAAAVTVVLMAMATCLVIEKPPDIDFVADHSFMYMIREDVSGAILFVGTLVNPLEDTSTD